MNNFTPARSTGTREPILTHYPSSRTTGFHTKIIVRLRLLCMCWLKRFASKRTEGMHEHNNLPKLINRQASTLNKWISVQQLFELTNCLNGKLQNMCASAIVTAHLLWF